MNFKSKLLISAGFAIALVTAAYAQWQAPNHSVPVGRGAGVTGFGSVGPCTANQLMVWTGGVGSNPACTATLPSGLTGYALTKTDDTNVTLTLGGSASTGLVAASSLTLGWTGQLAVGRGGTGQSTLTSDGILYGAGAGAIGSGRCTMNSDQGISCSSGNANTPQWLPTNSSADASSANIIFQKSRAGGNSNSGDQLGSVLFKSFANSSVQNASQIASRQTAAATGSNTPTAIDFRTSDSAGQLNQSWVMDGAGKSFQTPNGGAIVLFGSTSGTATVKTAAIAGTSNFQLPVGNGTSGFVLQTDGAGNTTWAAAAAGAVDVQVFTATGANTWTRAGGATFVDVFICGAGGGGGGGGRMAASTQGAGGSGAGGGFCHHTVFKAADAGASQTVTIGAGGTAGTGATVNGNAGTVGGIGSNSTFGSLLTAFGGGGGAGGTSGTVQGGGGGGGGPQVAGGSGAAGSAQGGSSQFANAPTGSTPVEVPCAGMSEPTTSQLMFTPPCPYGGGGGGAVDAGGAAQQGGLGQDAIMHGGGGGAGGSFALANVQAAGGAGGRSVGCPTAQAGGAAGNNAGGSTAADFNYHPGCGGGGGGSSSAVAAGNGGNGTNAGGGGGGGAGDAVNAGNGGTGGNGFARIISW